MSRPSFADALEEDPQGLRLHLVVTAKAPAARFPDRYDPWRKRIGIRVRAAARRGEANREVVRLVARFFGRSESDVRIARGDTTSHKTVVVQGIRLKEAHGRLMGGQR